jgi:hypothetical protein
MEWIIEYTSHSILFHTSINERRQPLHWKQATIKWRKFLTEQIFTESLNAQNYTVYFSLTSGETQSLRNSKSGVQDIVT